MEAESVIRFETVAKLNFLLNSFNKTEDEHKKIKSRRQHLGDLESNILDNDKTWSLESSVV